MVNTNSEEPMNGIYIDKTKKSKAERYKGNRVVLIMLRPVAVLGMFMDADVVATSVAWVYHEWYATAYQSFIEEEAK
jgi:hypothetical protein